MKFKKWLQVEWSVSQLKLGIVHHQGTTAAHPVAKVVKVLLSETQGLRTRLI